MRKFSKLILIYDTVRYLKPIQIASRILLFAKSKTIKNQYNANKKLTVDPLLFSKSVDSGQSLNENTFTFLNLSKDFNGNINWEYPSHGRLWAYNLNYFDYLNQAQITKQKGLELIDNFMSHQPYSKIGMEVYPISLRCMNWIRFFTTHAINEDSYNTILYNQLNYLVSRAEYHLLGNHLLENGFALFFGAYYFNDQLFYSKAKKILIPELEEQILDDGAHFELSPMYHCIMLSRVLDCYNLASNNARFDKELAAFLKGKAQKMLNWLNTINFEDKTFPLFNDAAFGIAPTIEQLNNYANQLGLSPYMVAELKSSGFRKYTLPNMELVLDIGPVGPDYQPGHAHADTFTFELHINNRPIIVDTGTSTYQVDNTRFYERSTAAHNTVVIKGKNSSQVWAGHRVGKRARVQIEKDEPALIRAMHDGYRADRVQHTRQLEIGDDSFIIQDEIQGQGVAYLHFAPSENPQLIDNTICGKGYIINLYGAILTETFESNFAPEFNKYLKRKSFRIAFNDRLVTKINLSKKQLG